ncbi:OmpA family protein [Mariprofundus sp. KV]|uniref:OmpA family protein n=1 Tax=Mariprofundus sp. KV TaxID=2608715 RepID=UPI0015A07DF3|nr:OmpA family protein [Mariprofundus sp. KV]NWF36478.1 OmpA family protein [Mariprofundus sp. KV]
MKETEDIEPNRDDSKDSDLKRLKALLLGDESEQLAEIQEHLHNPELQAADVGRVLHRAVTINQEHAPDALRDVLTPTVESALYKSVRNSPDRLGEALFPVMAPAIRKSIVSIMSSMVQSLNQMLEHSFTLKGLKWRLEALQSGRSFAEIVMLHTLAYRVEQLFLIHKESGLLLQHVSFDEAANKDADLVSSMLTAIQDFVRDSFQVGENDAIDKLRIGSMEVFIEAGSKAVIAAVVRGNAPADFPDTLQQSSEAIHKRMADKLDAFDGDTAPFNAIRPELEKCLLSKSASSGSPSNLKAVLALSAAAIILIGWFSWGAYQSHRQSLLVEALDAVPGITVIRSSDRNGALQISGMRDPLADTPQSVLREYQFSDDDVQMQWSPYQSLEPLLIIRRARALLAPADQTELALDGSELVISGVATQVWLERAKQLAPAMAGITGLRSDQLILTDSPDYLLQLARKQLAPPATVQLSIRGHSLLAKGSAHHKWILTATAGARKIPGISAYDDSGVIDLDSDSYLLSEARKILLPPSTVRLKVEQAHLFASGRATSEWIANARQQAHEINGIKRFDASKLTTIITSPSDRQLLAEAKRRLAPPEGVTLSVEQRILSVSGIAPSAWAKKAIEQAKSIKGLKGYDQQALVIAESALKALKKRLNGLQLKFRAGSSQLESDEEQKISQLALTLNKQASLIQMAQAHIDITGYSGLLTNRAHALALSRAKHVTTLLTTQGVPSAWIRTHGQKERSSDWAVDLDLKWKPLP